MSAIGQLIAGVAHDLNNPLASVVGFSDLLGEAADVPPRLAEPLAVIRQEAERASRSSATCCRSRAVRKASASCSRSARSSSPRISCSRISCSRPGSS